MIEWNARRGGGDDYSGDFSLPVVAETWDGFLNDINGFHVRKEHVFQALDGATAGPVAEGSVGGGTGMIVHQFKGGIGTASRRVTAHNANYTVGVLVQANYGTRESLTIAGVPVGKHLAVATTRKQTPAGDSGSIIVVLATDAPLLAQQLQRLARRPSLALGRMGSYSGNGSGDIFFAFSTANAAALTGKSPVASASLGNDDLDPVFKAAVQATEEAIVNALVAARDMRGTEGHFAPALPHDELVALLKRYGRYVPPRGRRERSGFPEFLRGIQR